MMVMQLLLALLLATLPARAQEPASGPQRAVYEGVIHDRGKTIGTTILLEISGNSVSGWIQRNRFRPIDSGSVGASSITFTSDGNTHTIDLKTSRISYSGPDGAGDQRVVKMESIRGRVYRLTEESDYGRYMTLQTPDGEKEFTVERPPAVWKREGPPIEQFSRLEEILGKTVTFWRVRTGGSYSIEVIEEPEGVNLLAKLPKEKKKKK